MDDYVGGKIEQVTPIIEKVGFKDIKTEEVIQ